MSASPTVLVTGATDGIGKETALALARRGANVIVHGRNAARADAVRLEIEAISRRSAPPVLLGDLASLASVRAMATQLFERAEAIDVLLNNAGVFMHTDERTVDGFETTFAVNHLAPFLLSHLLLDLLAKSSDGRVVNVASMAHARGAISMQDLDTKKAAFTSYGAYASSKQANVLFTVELARRLGPNAKVTTTSLHPGVVSTKLLTEGFGMTGGDSLDEGAKTSVFLALDASAKARSGKYFVRSKEAVAATSAREPALARAFYLKSAELVGIAPLPEPA
jgi:NAD(P)-dependent dehydrogenase (short-subunit alcohol dehydrogenase family)